MSPSPGYETVPVGDGYRELTTGERVERNDELLDQFSYDGEFKWVGMASCRFNGEDMFAGKAKGVLTEFPFRIRRRVTE